MAQAPTPVHAATDAASCHDVRVELKNNGFYLGDTSADGLFHGFGELHVGDNGGSSYRGEFVRDKKHGLGTSTRADSLFVGQWLDDVPHGFGRLQFKGGDYFGHFADGVFHGDGVLVYKDGTRYSGPFVRGAPEGERGHAQYTDGASYLGPFLDGRMHGPGGEFRFPDGSFYCGAVTDGHVTGVGRLVYADRVYEGPVLGAKPHGAGVMCWLDGRRYEGEFVAGRRHGAGTFRWPDQASYSGNWESDAQHDARGVFVTAAGDRHMCHFEHGVIVDKPEAQSDRFLFAQRYAMPASPVSAPSSPASAPAARSAAGPARSPASAPVRSPPPAAARSPSSAPATAAPGAAGPAVRSAADELSPVLESMFGRMAERLTQLRSTFATYDVDKSGTISFAQLHQAMRSLKLRPSDDEYAATKSAFGNAQLSTVHYDALVGAIERWLERRTAQ